MTALAIVFWISIGLLVYAHLGYPVVLWALARSRASRPGPDREGQGDDSELPRVSLIVAAHDEQDVIERKVRDALEQDYPRDRLEVIVASDGSTDGTVQAALAAGADEVLDLPRGGKVAALNAAVERSTGEILAFSDANSFWRPNALRQLVARLRDPEVGYVCGQVRFDGAGAANEEGLYWRYEMAVRELESRLAGVTAGNGAINAVRRDAYLFLDPTRGQDISFPYELVKRGWRPVYAPEAVARERLAATIGGEFGRKRRMMAGAWSTMLRHGLLSPRGYGPLYAFEIVSHRMLRYASPFLHLIALGTNIALAGEGTLYVVTLAAQIALLVAAAIGTFFPLRPFRIANYYLAVTASSAAGLWEYLRHGVPTTWDKAEGTR
jgi:cellulose synthase/poly-beta-1,6-N-acetylglucosamine synthase-like glycosyltransferase